MSRRIRISLFLTLVLQVSCGSLIVRPLDSQRLLDRSGFEWDTWTAQGFGTFYVEQAVSDVAPSEVVGRAASDAKTRVLEFLGLGDYDALVTVFLVESRERMERLIGRRTNATGFHDSNVLCLVWTRAGSDGLIHELLHVVAMNVWGVPERWINEGVAVDVTGHWNGLDLDAVARSLMEQGSLPGLDELTGHFGSLPSPVSYPAAGSFLRFVRDEHSIEAIRRLWSEGTRSLESVSGRDLRTLEQDWLERIRSAQPLPEPYDWRVRVQG